MGLCHIKGLLHCKETKKDTPQAVSEYLLTSDLDIKGLYLRHVKQWENVTRKKKIKQNTNPIQKWIEANG